MKLSIVTATFASLVVLAVPAIAQAKAYPPVGKCDTANGSIRCNLPGWATKIVVTGKMEERTVGTNGAWQVLKTRKGQVSVSIDCGPNSGALSSKRQESGNYTFTSANLLGFARLLRSSKSCKVEVFGTPPAPRANAETQITFELAYK